MERYETTPVIDTQERDVSGAVILGEPHPPESVSGFQTTCPDGQVTLKDAEQRKKYMMTLWCQHDE